MTSYTPDLDRSIIRSILDEQGGHSCAYGIASVSNSIDPVLPYCRHVTVDGVDNGSSTTGAVDQTYAIASGTKPMINLALYRLIEEGEVVLEDKQAVLEDNQVRKMMRDAWDKRAFPLCNELRKYRLGKEYRPWRQPEHWDPTIRELMTHIRGFPKHQRGLFGPDGSFLMSEDTFGQIFAALVDRHSHVQREGFCYSNWNALLLGFIIKYATGMSLADALKRLVLMPCKMNNTILDSQTFDKMRSKIASPNINTAMNGPRQSIFPNILNDDAALAVVGGFSCIEDMTKLFQHILGKLLYGGNQTKATLFYSPDSFRHKGAEVLSFPTGICANLDSQATGFESFEQIPGSKSHQLGRDLGTSIQAISKAGALRGYSCHFYMIPSKKLVIVVMTNTSGIADSSQLVAQYLIQQMARLDDPTTSFGTIAAEIYNENRASLAKQATCHRTQLTFSVEELDQLPGCYAETWTKQRIIIPKPNHDQIQLSVYIEEGGGNDSKRSSEMTLIKIAESILAFLPHPDYLAIDVYESWRNFGLEIIRHGNGNISALAKATGHDVLGNRAEEHSAFNEYYGKQFPQPSRI